MSLSVLLLYLRLFFIAFAVVQSRYICRRFNAVFSRNFSCRKFSARVWQKQIDGCARSAEIMVKKGDRRHIWYDVGIPCQI